MNNWLIVCLSASWCLYTNIMFVYGLFYLRPLFREHKQGVKQGLGVYGIRIAFFCPSFRLYFVWKRLKVYQLSLHDLSPAVTAVWWLSYHQRTAFCDVSTLRSISCAVIERHLTPEDMLTVITPALISRTCRLVIVSFPVTASQNLFHFEMFSMYNYGQIWTFSFGLVYLFSHWVTHITLDTAITDYNLQHNI